ncbi:piggyBac transposable element-derived protein 4-like, partial [Clupea harengus]|uniref:PiggyBac transposable element-derived protein 4-like n=1 Tax=Clupea harengus TaxID=7950 RepID=A0A8M1KDH7_CLUHA
MKKYTTEQALEFMFEDSEEDDVGSWADDNSDGASIDSFDELDWEERIDRVLDISSDLPGPSRPPPARRQMKAKRRVRSSSKAATASTPWLLPSKRRRPAPLGDRGHAGGSEENVCPSQISAGQTRAKRRVKSSSKTATAPIPLLPPSPVDRWHDGAEEDMCPPQFLFCPKRMPGPQLDSQKSYSPKEIFDLFFTNNAITTLCINTNKYAARKIAEGAKMRWKEVKPSEMCNYLSIVLYLGLVKVTAARDLWKKENFFKFPYPRSVMKGYRYEAITANLHMSDPAADVVNDQLRGQPGYDGLFRLKPLHDDILTACRTHYHPHKNLSVDERMVATKGKERDETVHEGQATKWGYKLFVLADSQSGYTCDFTIYEGKAPSPSGNGLTFDAVVKPAQDNFYTSTKLFSHLHQVRFGACGTIRENRVGFPRTTDNALGKKAARGDMRWIREGSLLYVKWKDTRDVTMCSTIHKANSGQSVQRRVCNPDDNAVVNSFLIHKEMAEMKNQKPLTQKKFRIALCEQLGKVGKELASNEASNEASTDHVPLEACGLSNDPHLKATKGRRKCRICKSSTIWL